MTAQGSPFARFRRALDRGNVTEALSSAAELEQVGLTEALELCLLLVEKSPERFGRAALRWHGRYCRELRDVDLDEGVAVLATLGALRGPRSKLAASALAELLGAPARARASQRGTRYVGPTQRGLDHCGALALIPAVRARSKD